MLRDYLSPVGGLEHKAIYQVVDLHVASAGDIEPLDEYMGSERDSPGLFAPETTQQMRTIETTAATM